MTFADSLTLALLDQLPGAIAVLDLREADVRVVLANEALCRLRGRGRETLLGLGVADLLEAPVAGARIADVRARLGRGEVFTAAVGPATGGESGVAFEVRFEPLRDEAGTVSHYVCFHEAVQVTALSATDPLLATMPPLMRDDRLTGLRHWSFFDELYRRDFSIAQREGRPLSLFLCDIDALGVYNETFGRQAGDSVIRRVGHTLSGALRRASDLVARLEGGRFVGLAARLDSEEAAAHGVSLASRVRGLHMHHPRSPHDRIVTLSVGVAHGVPERGTTAESFLGTAQAALSDARSARAVRTAEVGAPLH